MYEGINLGSIQVQSSFSLDVDKDLLINSCNLQLGKIVGQGIIISYSHLNLTIVLGEFGIVYKALLKEGYNKKYSETVAVKTLKGITIWPHTIH